MKKLVGIVCLLSLLLGAPVFAQGINDDSTGGNPIDQNPQTGGTIRIHNPLGVDSPQLLIGKVINNILGIVGSLALVMFIYGGLIWMTSSGSSEKVKQGRDILIWSIIGLVVIFSSYALVRFVIMGVGA